MFSSRLRWDLEPNALARLLARKRAGGVRILDLTESNPTAAGIPYPAEEILSALADDRSLVYEPSPRGLPAAREAVARYYTQRGLAVSPDRILLTASTSEAYAYVFKLLADPGDEILVPRPSYPLFEYLASLEGLRTAQYPLVYHDGWFLDRDAMAAAVTPRTRAIVLVNPNNPTGSFLRREELDWLERMNLPLVCDEVFADYTFGPDAARVETLVNVERTFCLSGLSKVAGLPQMKLGWIVAGPAAMEGLELIADTYLSAGTPVQHALGRLLAAGEPVRAAITARVRENLSVLRKTFEPLAVEGGWYATLRVPRIRGEEEWALELLDRHNVLVQPGFFYDFGQEAFLVLSLLPPRETFRAGVERLKRLAE